MPARSISQKVRRPQGDRLGCGASRNTELGILDSFGGPLQVEDQITIRWEGRPGIDVEAILSRTAALGDRASVPSAKLQ